VSIEEKSEIHIKTPTFEGKTNNDSLGVRYEVWSSVEKFRSEKGYVCRRWSIECQLWHAFLCRGLQRTRICRGQSRSVASDHLVWDLISGVSVPCCYGQVN